LVQRASMRVRTHTGRPGGSKRIAHGGALRRAAVSGRQRRRRRRRRAAVEASGRTMIASRTSASSAKVARNAHNARLSLVPAGTP
jgi:hypothetical protein